MLPRTICRKSEGREAPGSRSQHRSVSGYALFRKMRGSQKSNLILEHDVSSPSDEQIPLKKKMCSSFLPPFFSSILLPTLLGLTFHPGLHGAQTLGAGRLCCSAEMATQERGWRCLHRSLPAGVCRATSSAQQCYSYLPVLSPHLHMHQLLLCFLSRE